MLLRDIIILRVKDRLRQRLAEEEAKALAPRDPKADWKPFYHAATLATGYRMALAEVELMEQQDEI